MDIENDDLSAHYLNSTLQERIVEHVFVGEALRRLWQRGVTDVEVLRSEFDAGGYDLVMSRGKVVRHIQFKTSMIDGKKASITASLKLMEKPSGCIIWILVDSKLEFQTYLWMGNDPGERLSDIQKMKPAKHTKGNAQGVKLERPNQRIVPKSEFTTVSSIDEVLDRLFGNL